MIDQRENILQLTESHISFSKKNKLEIWLFELFASLILIGNNRVIVSTLGPNGYNLDNFRLQAALPSNRFSGILCEKCKLSQRYLNSFTFSLTTTPYQSKINILIPYLHLDCSDVLTSNFTCIIKLWSPSCVKQQFSLISGVFTSCPKHSFEDEKQSFEDGRQSFMTSWHVWILFDLPWRVPLLKYFCMRNIQFW